MISPVTRRGRYFCFCSSVPKQTSGVIVSPVCAPNVVANDAHRPTASPTMMEEILSRSSPPYSSATSVAWSPS
jgi:hypothetical protein